MLHTAWPSAPDWQTVLQAFWCGPAGISLEAFLADRVANGAVVYPPHPLRALELTPLKRTKVVVLGQDPYHGAGQAHGLAFSVLAGVKVPPSLRNIQKELARDTGQSCTKTNLEDWACQGVLLLNTCLTVEKGLPGSHAKRGWEVLTDELIRVISNQALAVVFMLWGAHAQSKHHLIDADRHCLLTANHPSPLSALRPPQPFIGCGHFSAANDWLQKRGIEPIRW